MHLVQHFRSGEMQSETWRCQVVTRLRQKTCKAKIDEAQVGVGLIALEYYVLQ